MERHDKQSEKERREQAYASRGDVIDGAAKNVVPRRLPSKLQGFTHTDAKARAEKIEHIRRAVRIYGGVHGDDARWMLNEYDRLQQILREARTELAQWGWGDFHYGDQPQEQSVVDTLAKIDEALNSE